MVTQRNSKEADDGHTKRRLDLAADRSAALHRLWVVRAAVPNQGGRGARKPRGDRLARGVYFLRSMRVVLSRRCNWATLHDPVRAAGTAARTGSSGFRMTIV